ncbi:hypothetical protein GCM10009827_068390 [Dactylosporangium maewongense]|uniref:Uncharacterized protein n=1 Tax=Dactylosporangium maewongense TaxID=634393 RepID=A0ABP4M7V0_9ACTN
MLSDFYIPGGYSAKHTDIVYFDRESTNPGAVERAKLEAIGQLPAAAVIDLIGFASDDEYHDKPDERAALIEGRLSNVELALEEVAGWWGEVHKKIEPANNAPDVDSRRLRRVTVSVRTGKQQPATELAPPHRKAPASIGKARATAYTYAAKTALALQKAGHDDLIAALARQFFGDDVDLRDLAERMRRLATFIYSLAEWTPDADEPPAPHFRYMAYGASRKAATGGHDEHAQITFGPQYVKASERQQTYTFLHESSHAALHTKDVSYTARRRFFLLDGRDALRNADSVALFVMLAMDPGFSERTFAPQDGYTGLTQQQTGIAKRTIADVETWLGLAAHHVDHLYRRVWQRLLNRGAVVIDENVRAAVAKAFPGALQDTLARPDDIVLTGIHWRLKEIRGLMDRSLQVVTADNPAALNPGVLVLPPLFFNLNPMDRREVLINQMAAQVPAIPSYHAPSYAHLVVLLGELKQF